LRPSCDIRSSRRLHVQNKKEVEGAALVISFVPIRNIRNCYRTELKNSSTKLRLPHKIDSRNLFSPGLLAFNSLLSQHLHIFTHSIVCTFLYYKTFKKYTVLFTIHTVSHVAITTRFPIRTHIPRRSRLSIHTSGGLAQRKTKPLHRRSPSSEIQAQEP
jgi:hypothetical protein